MNRLIFASLMLGLSACASHPEAISGNGFKDDMISANRYRVSYDGPPTMSQNEVEDRTLAHAAQLTIEKGNEWFEIKDQASASHKRTIEFVMGKGESLAGGAKQFDAKKTLAEIRTHKYKSEPGKTS